MNNALGLDFNYLFAGFYPPSFSQIIMILIGAYLIYMSIYYNKKPLLLLPMGVAILAANVPLPKITEDVINGFLGMIYNGASSGVYSVLVFFPIHSRSYFLSYQSDLLQILVHFLYSLLYCFVFRCFLKNLC